RLAVGEDQRRQINLNVIAFRIHAVLIADPMDSDGTPLIVRFHLARVREVLHERGEAEEPRASVFRPLVAGGEVVSPGGDDSWRHSPGCHCSSSTCLICAPVRSSVSSVLANGWTSAASLYVTSPASMSVRTPPGFMNAITGRLSVAARSCTAQSWASAMRLEI